MRLPPPPTRQEIRDLAKLAGPVVLVQLATMAMGVEDTMIVGRYSSTALAGVALGVLYAWTLSIFGLGLVMGLDPLVSQAVGAKDEAAVARAFQRGLAIIGVFGTLVLGTLIPARAILGALGQDPAVIDVAAPYIVAVAPSQYAFLLFAVMRSVLQARGNMRPMLVAILAGNVVNVALSIVLVFGLWGFPRMGPVGSGIGTLAARWVMCLVLAAVSWREFRPLVRPQPHALAWAPMKRVLRIGTPVGLQLVAEFGVFAVIGLAMGNLGATPMAAHQMTLNIASLTYMVPLGVSIAGSVLVGRAIGAGEPQRARRVAVTALQLGVGFMVLSGITFLCFPQGIARLYTNDAATIALAATLVPIAGVFQVFDGTQVISIGVLRGTGDTRTPMVVNMIGYWCIGLPVSLWLGRGLGMGARGLWWGLVCGLATVAIIVLVRVATHLRGPLERIHVDTHDPAPAPLD